EREHLARLAKPLAQGGHKERGATSVSPEFDDVPWHRGVLDDQKKVHKAVGRNYAPTPGRGDRSDPIGIVLDERDERSVLQPGAPEVTGANIATRFYSGVLVHWGRLQMLELLQFGKHRRGRWRAFRTLA